MLFMAKGVESIETQPVTESAVVGLFSWRAKTRREKIKRGLF